MGTKIVTDGMRMFKCYSPVQLLEAVISNLPHAKHITDLDIRVASLRFTWKGDRYSVCSNGLVERVGGTDGGMLISDDKARYVHDKVNKGLARLERREG